MIFKSIVSGISNNHDSRAGELNPSENTVRIIKRVRNMFNLFFGHIRNRMSEYERFWASENQKNLIFRVSPRDRLTVIYDTLFIMQTENEGCVSSLSTIICRFSLLN